MRKSFGFKIRFRTFVLVMHLVCVITGMDSASAEEYPSADPVPLTRPQPVMEAPQKEKSPMDLTSEIVGTMDKTHAGLERTILEQVIRFDDFFGKAETESQKLTGYKLRWRNSMRIERGRHAQFGTSASANFALSKISKRLRLTIYGEDEPSQFAPGLPEDPGNPGYDRTLQANTRLVNTELRYNLLQTPSMSAFVGAGIRLAIPPEAFSRFRFQYVHHFSDVSLIRIGETPFVNSANGLGQTTEISLERLLRRGTLLRWANSVTASQKIQGVEWGTELSLLHELSPRSAITFLTGAYGNTSVADGASNYRALVRYRRNFLRSWLYYELEPEISLPRNENKNFCADYAFTFRLEIVFQGTADGKKEKPAAR